MKFALIHSVLEEAFKESKLIIYYTPLHYASQENAIDIAKLLIENGADINARTDICQIFFH